MKNSYSGGNSGNGGIKRISGNVYAKCCVMTFFASFLGLVNPVLSGVFTQNAFISFNIKGAVPTAVIMLAVKGTRMFLRSRVGKYLKGSMRAPLIWLKQRISRKLWWMEPMVDNWGWVGMVISKLTGGVSLQAASFIVTMMIDTLNVLIAGIVYYFTHNYILSLMSALILPLFTVIPWFANKATRFLHIKKQRLNRNKPI